MRRQMLLAGLALLLGGNIAFAQEKKSLWSNKAGQTHLKIAYCDGDARVKSFT